MAIETSGRRSLTGSATSSGKSGCALSQCMVRAFREKSNERRGVPIHVRAAPA